MTMRGLVLKCAAPGGGPRPEMPVGEPFEPDPVSTGVGIGHIFASVAGSLC